ncbi:MAG TPA: DUF4397 domain-containing protein [Chitinophagaceae bacterium]|nr:DUF4397 domain-containing protein [Chitinophagaceae bacterium]
MHRRNLLTLLITVASIFSLASCLKPGNNNGSNNNTTPQSGLFIIHASADAPTMDIYANNGQINTQPFGYTNNSQGYLAMNSNIYLFNFTRYGSTTNLVSQTDSLGDYKDYSLILYDSLADLKLMYILDDFASTVPVAANIRFFDLCPNLPSMDVYLDTIPIYTGRTFADNLQNQALDTFIQESAQSHVLTLRFPYHGSTATFQSTVPLYQGKIYTIYASGFAGGLDSLSLKINVAQNY